VRMHLILETGSHWTYLRTLRSPLNSKQSLVMDGGAILR